MIRQGHTKPESLDELMDHGFSESTMKDMEDYCNREKETKLKKSKSISLWLKFFEEWFSIPVDLKSVFIFGGKLPGYNVVVVPKELSSTQCLVLLRDKLGIHISDEIIANAKDVAVARRKRETYLVPIQYKDQRGCLGNYFPDGILRRINCKPIELVLINLFEFYSTGKKINAFNGDPDRIISSFKLIS